MKKILYLTFYFEPDLCAGSFRNTPLAKELAKQVNGIAEIDVITTMPNRYGTFDQVAPSFENFENLSIHRIVIPKHKSGFSDQINSFKTYFFQTHKLVRNKKYDLVFASSSRLFTAYLGYSVARKLNIPLYLDIRDIFIDTMNDVFKNQMLKAGVLPILKIIEKRIFNYASHINLISGGFKEYFKKFKALSYSEFPNGIDPEFLNLPVSVPTNRSYKLITYAGNLGEGQGLHIIIPDAAKRLGHNYRFLIIGDGGLKQTLINEVERLKLTNVEIKKPLSRKELLKIYSDSDFLFLHLNNYEAFKKVLPSKIFELGAYDKPIIAGVDGYPNEFIKQNLTNVILFLPGNVDDMVRQLETYNYHTAFRNDFKKKFKRDEVNRLMSESIISYL